MTAPTATDSDETVYRIAALPLQFDRSDIQQLFARGYDRYVVDGTEQPQDLLADVERLGTGALREQVRNEASDVPFVDDPGTLAVVATLSAICVKSMQRFEQTPPRNIQPLFDIRDLYINNLGSLVREYGDSSLQQDIAEVLYAKDEGEEGPHPGRVCVGIEEKPAFGGGVYLKIPMAAASRACLVRESEESTGDDAIRTKVQDNHLYVPVGDFDEKYHSYAREAFSKLLRVQEQTLSSEQLTWLTTNESAITERIDRFAEAGHHDRLWRNWDKGEQVVRALRNAITDSPDETVSLGEFHTARELYAALECYDPDDQYPAPTEWITNARSLATLLSDHDSHTAITIDRDGSTNSYRIGRSGRGSTPIDVTQISDLFELPCLENMEDRLHDKKPVRKDLYNFARMVMWLPQYRNSPLDVIVEDLKQVFSRWPWYDEQTTDYQIRYEFSQSIDGETPLPMNCDNDGMQRYCIGKEQCPYSIWGSVPFPDEMYEMVAEGDSDDSSEFGSKLS